MLLLCFIGLNGFFLTWGFLQEKLVTQEYTLAAAGDGAGAAAAEGATERFPSITFLIFCNRLVAICVALTVLLLRRSKQSSSAAAPDAPSATTQTRRTPYELTSVASLANTLSSYFQYAALQHVSFPVQVLSKACKMIPNMAVGLLLGRRFKRYEYVMAVLVPIGVAVFSYDQHYLTVTGHDNDGDAAGAGAATAAAATAAASASDSATTVADAAGMWTLSSGAALGYAMISVYLLLDALTSNWQSHLFKTHHMNSYQMMLGVNLFSFCMTLGWLLMWAPDDELVRCVAFLLRHPAAQLHVLALALCNALGQLFIYYTISTYGALVFTMIMTTRQVFSIAVSVAVFGHKVGPVGGLGAAIVFATLGYKIYAGHTAGARNKAAEKDGEPNGNTEKEKTT